MTIVYTFPHRLGMPGIGTTAYKQIEALRALGHTVHVFATSFKAIPAGPGKNIATLQLLGRRIPQKAIGVDRSFSFHDWRVSRAIAKLGPVDSIHCWPLGSLRTIARAKKLGIPTFLERPNTHTQHAYEVVEEECRRIGFQLVDGHSHKPSASRLSRELAEYAACDFLLVPSEAVKKTFTDRGFAPARLCTTQYGCDLNRFQPGSQSERSETEPLRVLFLGRCEPRKGLHYALDAWGRAGLPPGAVFKVVGNFVPGYRDWLGARMQQPGVEALSFVSDPSSLLRDTDVLLLPSIEEGSALVTYEAMASGCTLLVTAETGAVIENRATGLVHAMRDVNALAAHIRELHQNRALLRALQREVLNRRATLSWLAAGESLARAYAGASKPA